MSEPITQEMAERMIADAIMSHDHKGNFSQRINFFDLFAFIDFTNVQSATIATTGNTDTYVLANATGNIIGVDFSATDALATSDTNYITWTITNLGQDGAGSAAILSNSALNTTKATGGVAITANSKRSFTLTSTLNDLNVVAGDRIRIRAAVTGTLANSVSFPVYLLQIQAQ